MRRLTIFAHYDKDNIIDGYVLYYLKALKQISEYIVFVSDCDLPECECSKLNGLVDYVLAQKHGEYDFGSYKRGFLLAIEKGLEYDELIFANDSCIGPFCSLKPIFERMEKKDYDFWGLTQNRYLINNEDGKLVYQLLPHIQSYFIVFSKEVANSSIFYSFMTSIIKENTKDDVVRKYEVELTRLLTKNGFSYGVWLKHFRYTENVLLSKYKLLLVKYKYPFLKTSLVKDNLVDCEILNKYNLKSYYPSELIKIYQERFKKNVPQGISCSLRDRIFAMLQRNLPVPLFLVYMFVDRKIFSNIRKVLFYITKNI